MPYTSGDLLVKAVFKTTTGLVDDYVVNDFAFRFPGPIDDAVISYYFLAVDNFYRVIQASTRAVSSYLSPYVDRAQTHQLQAYLISAAGTGSPLRTDPWIGPIAASYGQGLPTEVAGVLSFHALLTGVQEALPDDGNPLTPRVHPAARRRGRLYIGPLHQFAIDSANPPYRLAAMFTETLRQAATALMADTNQTWSVWSRKDQILRPVVGGWTDNAPDTQRRRGIAASARVNWA